MEDQAYGNLTAMIGLGVKGLVIQFPGRGCVPAIQALTFARAVSARMVTIAPIVLSLQMAACVLRSISI